MRLTPMLTRAQVETIHRNALRVLAELGVRVEHEGVRLRLAAVGGRADAASEVVRFPASDVERLIAEARKAPRPERPPAVGIHVGVYGSQYLDPESDALRPFDENLLAGYFGLAHHLGAHDGVGLLGLPFVPEGIPAPYMPLSEKLFAWKWGARPDGSVLSTALCEPLLEMFSCHAAAQGRKLPGVFCATGYVISPLRLARPECEQLLFFAERGLRMGIGHLPSQGGTAPVTFAGALVLALAEQLFLYLLRRAFWEEAELSVGGTVSTLDMRRACSCYGRPEQQRINAAFTDLASFYGCACGGHTGLTDAKRPSCEAGAQKALGTLYTALACGHGSLSAGLLGIDEVCSPVQMVLDADLADALRALLAAPEVDELECACDEILAVGHGGQFLGTPFTAERFRRALFQPRTWAWQNLSGWAASGGKLDVDLAREFLRDWSRRFVPAPAISAEEERELRRIIRRAVESGLLSRTT